MKSINNSGDFGWTRARVKRHGRNLEWRLEIRHLYTNRTNHVLPSCMGCNNDRWVVRFGQVNEFDIPARVRASPTTFVYFSAATLASSRGWGFFRGWEGKYGIVWGRWKRWESFKVWCSVVDMKTRRGRSKGVNFDQGFHNHHDSVTSWKNNSLWLSLWNGGFWLASKCVNNG